MNSKPSEPAHWEPTVQVDSTNGTTRFTAPTSSSSSSSAAVSNTENQQTNENIRHYPLAPIGFGNPPQSSSISGFATVGNESDQRGESFNLRHYPLAPASVVEQVQAPLNTINEKVQFQKRLEANYPAKYVLYLALLILALNILVLYCEISLNQLRYYRYHTTFVGKYAVITSIGNNLYALLAIFTSKFIYFLIQLVSLLHLVGFFGTAFFPVFLNIFSFILSALEGSCQGRCLLVEPITIIAAFFSAVFSMAMFVKIQFNFLTNLNRNTFATYH